MIDAVTVEDVDGCSARLTVVFEEVFTGKVFWIVTGKPLPNGMRTAEVIGDLVKGRNPEKYLRWKYLIDDMGCEPSVDQLLVSFDSSDLEGTKNYVVYVASYPSTTEQPCISFKQFKTGKLAMAISRLEYLDYQSTGNTTGKIDATFSTSTQGHVSYVLFQGDCKSFFPSRVPHLSKLLRPSSAKPDTSIVRLCVTGGALSIPYKGKHALSIVSKAVQPDQVYTLVVQADDAPSSLSSIVIDTNRVPKVRNITITTEDNTENLCVKYNSDASGVLWYACFRAGATAPWLISDKSLQDMVRRGRIGGNGCSDVFTLGRTAVPEGKGSIQVIKPKVASCIILLPSTLTGRCEKEGMHRTVQSDRPSDALLYTPKITNVQHCTSESKVRVSVSLGGIATHGTPCCVFTALIPETLENARALQVGLRRSKIEHARDNPLFMGCSTGSVRSAKGTGPHTTTHTVKTGMAYKIFAAVEVVGYGALSIQDDRLWQCFGNVKETPVMETPKPTIRRHPDGKNIKAQVDSWREGRPKPRKKQYPQQAEFLTFARKQITKVNPKTPVGWVQPNGTAGTVPPLPEKGKGRRRVVSTEHILELKQFFCKVAVKETYNSSHIVGCQNCKRTHQYAEAIKVVEVPDSPIAIRDFYAVYLKGFSITESHRVRMKYSVLQPITPHNIVKWLKMVAAAECNEKSMPWVVTWPSFLVLCTFQEPDLPTVERLFKQYTEKKNDVVVERTADVKKLLCSLTGTGGDGGLCETDFYRGMECNFPEILISVVLDRVDQYRLLQSRGRGSTMSKNYLSHHTCGTQASYLEPPCSPVSQGISLDFSFFQSSCNVTPFTPQKQDVTMAFSENARGQFDRLSKQSYNIIYNPQERKSKLSCSIPLGKQEPFFLGSRPASAAF